MTGFYIELTESGTEHAVYVLESRCGDFPECHDEDNPCDCNAT